MGFIVIVHLTDTCMFNANSYTQKAAI